MNEFFNAMVAGFTSLSSRPVVLLILLTGPVILLAWRRRIFPSMAFVLWAILPCVLSTGVMLKQDWVPLILAVDAAIVVVVLVDLNRIADARTFAVQRDCQRIASLKKKHRVTLTINNLGNRSEHVQLRDGVPQEFDVEPDEFGLVLPPRSRTSIHYELKASRRGAFEIDAVHVKVRSRLGLWIRFLDRPHRTTINVYPDLKQLSEYALLARTNRLNLMGVRRTRRVGQDNEFERLRDYTLDDNYKHIDWRSTARRSRLTVKDFQVNQSQRVMFMVDCGRMMTNEASGLSLLDHALNSMLMLSYVALERNDAVGLITFSSQIHSSMPARSGRSQMNHLLHASYDRFPQLVESRYEEAFLHLASRCRKRALVVLISNVIDEVNARQLYTHLGSLTGRHLALAVLLRDHRMFDPLQHAQQSSTHFYRSAAAAEIVNWRQRVITDLQQRGVLVVDAFPEQLTAPLINQYLEIKARHLL